MNNIANAQKSFLPAGDPEWLGSTIEDILDPDLPIVDPHHHLWGAPRSEYLGQQFAADMQAGHNFVATVFADCSEAYRTEGPEAYRPVGETEFAARVGRESDAGAYGDVPMCQGIISRADLAEGAAVKGVLEAHIEAGEGRFKGIRFSSAWDPSPEVRSTARTPPEGLLREPVVLEGARELAPLGLVLDLWLYHHQLSDAAFLADALPDQPMVLNHVGGPVRIGPYADRRDEVYTVWLDGIRELAKRENMSVKVGGLGMRLLGFGFENEAKAPTSQQLCDAWKPFVEPCLELFGADRCMFESNFPVDSLSCSYSILWNAFKRLADGYSAKEREAMFAGTAARVYSLDI